MIFRADLGYGNAIKEYWNGQLDINNKLDYNFVAMMELGDLSRAKYLCVNISLGDDNIMETDMSDNIKCIC
jgi:hypothetical protein